MKKMIALMALTAMPVISQAALVNVVQNGSFETNAGGTKVLPTAAAPLVGWSTVAGNPDPYVDVINTSLGFGQAKDLNYFIELDTNCAANADCTNSNSAVKQTFSGLSGVYDFSFWYSANPGNTHQPSSNFEVLWNGSRVTGNYFQPAVANSGNSTNVWVNFNGTLTSSGATDTLIFRALGLNGSFTDGDGVGARIDNVSLIGNAAVAAVPEADTYTMMLAGLGLLGFVSRRRQS